MSTTSIIIPARMASTRYPNKPLAEICGVTMIERVWRLAKAVKRADEVFIATDDLRLKEFAERFGASVVMTSSACKTGTDRVAEAARTLGLGPNDLVLNLQGDAVLTPPFIMEPVLAAMQRNPDRKMGTAAVHLKGEALSAMIKRKQAGSTSGTCVVFDPNHRALYFSSSLIPFPRQGNQDARIFQHIGLYAYRNDTLQQFSKLDPTPLEETEKLEQLRALENNIPIHVVEVDYQGRTHGSVDNLDDVANVEAIIAAEGELL